MKRIFITGTGTGIGKTHFACALARAASLRKRRVVAFKPIESGIEPGLAQSSDAAALAAASAPAFQRLLAPVYTLREPLSPHLAARRANITIDLQPVTDAVHLFDPNELDVLIVELAGGLFTPLNNIETNADLIAAIRRASHAPLTAVLVAPDRLGVLHDVAATTRAANAMGLSIEGIVLVTPEEPDASTGINGGEIPHVTDVPVLGVLRRATIESLSSDSQLKHIATTLTTE